MMNRLRTFRLFAMAAALFSLLLCSFRAHAGTADHLIRIDIHENGGDLGIVVVPLADIGGNDTDIFLEIRQGSNTFGDVRREGAYPYEWGTSNSNKVDSPLLNLAAGTYTLRATIDSGAHDGKYVTKNVTVAGALLSFDVTQNSNGDLGVEVFPTTNIGGGGTDIKLEIREGSGTFRNVRTEGAAPYEWGRKNANKWSQDSARLGNLSGVYTLRATIVSGSFNGQSATQTVTVNGGGTPTLPGFQYVKLSRSFNGSFQTNGADYLLIVKSHGRNWRNKADEGWFRASGYDDNVGVVGSHDKGMMLLDVRGTSSINIDVNNSATQILRITTNDDMDVLNKGQGVVDPGKGGEKVQGLGSGITFYAEDEGGKGDRDQDFGGISERVFGTGDDLLYVITGTQKSRNNGNGAIMHTSLN